ncbi:MAG: hypothetical protein K6C95_11070 [Lachnospiraceae bacterium]|nr:hypothetical protein [Lachnospiraceae bacterium]
MNMNNKNGTAVDRWLWNFIEKHFHELVIAVLLIGSVVLRIKLAPETGLSSDYELYIKGWPEMYRELGFVGGMRQVIGDYYVPFNIMYAIIGLSPWEPWVLASLFSCVMDYFLAGVVFFLMRYLFEETSGKETAGLKAMYTAVLTLYLPLVFMNSALWKQCDVFYISFALLAVYLEFKDRHTAALVMLGISFAFKLQAVFFFPFFAIMWLKKKDFSIFRFLWIPGIYLIAGLPAVFCKRGLRATYGTYFMQTLEGTEGSESYGMVANYPNLYNFGLDNYLETMALPAVLVTLAILLLSVVLALRGLRAKPGAGGSVNSGTSAAGNAGASASGNTTASVSGNTTAEALRLLYLLAWQIWACNMFLPSMHERYDYGAVLIFSLLVPLMWKAGINPSAAIIPAAVLNVGTFITYIRSARPDLVPVSMSALTAVYIAAFFVTTVYLVSLFSIEKNTE